MNGKECLRVSITNDKAGQLAGFVVCKSILYEYLRASIGGLYRYGFNGKENDNEIKGEGNQQDYGMRIYDPRVGRFLSIDPITKDYPWYTPYQFAGNKPIIAVDLDGAEELVYYDKNNYADSKLTMETVFSIKKGIRNLTWFVADVVATGRGGVKWRTVIERDENDFPIGLKDVYTGNRSSAEKTVATVGDIVGVGSLYTGPYTKDLSGAFMLAKAPNATVGGQINKMLGELSRNIVTHELENVVKNFKNRIFQVGKNDKLMLDKAALTHILGRHHPEFRQGADKALQSNFSGDATVNSIINTIGDLIKNNRSKIQEMMSGKGASSAEFKLNGKTYQLGVDPKNKSRIGQFFEK